VTTPDKLTIETPEQTSLEFPLAGIGSRFLALAADTVIQMSVLLFLFLVAEMVAPVVRLLGAASLWVYAALIIGGFLVYVAYFAFFEAVWNGQTPGKRLVGLRVMKDDGRPIGVYDAITRNLLRIVDQMPGVIYAVGIIVMLFSDQSKRVGDHVAGTVVVHERTLEGARPFARTRTETPELFFDASRVSLEEFQLIEMFLQRRDSLETDVRRAMAVQIANRLAAKLGVESAPWPACENLLEAIFAEVRAKGLRQ
jgi:uncharacterized RDD family membrane protein YckC